MCKSLEILNGLWDGYWGREIISIWAHNTFIWTINVILSRMESFPCGHILRELNDIENGLSK
jgi:hypothetical protein